MRRKLTLICGVTALSLAGCWDRDTPAPRDDQPRAAETVQAADAPAFGRDAIDASASARIAEIERRVGGRLGVMLVSPDARVIVANRDTERFPICSTFKLPLAVMVLSDVDAGRMTLDRDLPLAGRQVVPNSPIVEQMQRDGATALTVEQALSAAMVHSDNTAANMLLTLVGDNSGYSRRIESAFGNDSIRMDRSQGVLNEDAARQEDTATPDAMVAVLARVFHGQALSDSSRNRLRGWMAESRTGSRRVRAGLPEEVTAGDKTGTCTKTYNSVGWIETGNGGRPWLYAAYLDQTDASEDRAQDALADVGRLFAQFLRPNSRPPEVAK